MVSCFRCLPSLVMIKTSEFGMPMLSAFEINVFHFEPGLLAIAQKECLLGMIDHEDPLVSENVWLWKVARSVRVNQSEK